MVPPGYFRGQCISGDMILKRTVLKRFIKDEQGATAVEYSIFVAFMSLTIVGGLELMGVSLSGFFTESASHMEAQQTN